MPTPGRTRNPQIDKTGHADHLNSLIGKAHGQRAAVTGEYQCARRAVEEAVVQHTARRQIDNLQLPCGCIGNGDGLVVRGERREDARRGIGHHARRAALRQIPDRNMMKSIDNDRATVQKAHRIDPLPDIEHTLSFVRIGIPEDQLPRTTPGGEDRLAG